MFLPWDAGLGLDDHPFVVIGAGPAGLFLANRLAARGKVLVIEAGSAGDTLYQGDDIYRLVSTGREYAPLGTRILAFGGTSNHWGGHSRPMSPEAFGARRGIDAWPIGYDQYTPHVDEARKFLGVAPFDTPSDPPSIVSGIFSGHDHLTATRFQYSYPILHLGEANQVAAQRTRTDIDFLTETRLLDIELSQDTSRVASISLMHRPSKEMATIGVRQLFLCTGGIENARILLWAGRKYAGGNPLLGGPNGLTGTQFTEKPYFFPIEVFIDARADLTGSAAGVERRADISWELSETLRKQHGLPSFGVFPEESEIVPGTPDPELTPGIYSSQSPSYLKLTPAFQFEQSPHDGSHVRLSGEVDAHGVPLPELRWELSAADLDAYRRATLLFCGVLSQKGYARCRLRPEYRVEDWSGAYIGYSNHHIGTTRMGTSRLDGVVDSDCRVFGLDNLFIAGSSVFPSTDYINPTLSLVALADRLADHVIKTGGD